MRIESPSQLYQVAIFDMSYLLVGPSLCPLQFHLPIFFSSISLPFRLYSPLSTYYVR